VQAGSKSSECTQKLVAHLRAKLETGNALITNQHSAVFVSADVSVSASA